MYEFAVVLLLGLATLKVVDLLADLVPGFGQIRTLLTFLVAIGAVVALDYSVFTGFDIAVRESWIGTLVTGLIVGSLTSAWRAFFAYLGLVETSDATPTERTRGGRPRVAA
jgi:hypothetical protein